MAQDAENNYGKEIRGLKDRLEQTHGSQTTIPTDGRKCSTCDPRLGGRIECMQLDDQRDIRTI